MNDTTDHGLTAAEAAERLGVELATVYAYASRGSLTRRPGPDGRRSRYDPDEVELLARKGRPRSIRRRPGAVDVVIGTTISEIGDGWIRYRGHDLVELAGPVPYEAVAHLLWTGDLLAPSAPSARSGWPRSPSQAAARAACRASTSLPHGAPISSRLAVGAAAASALLPAEPGRAAAALVDALVAALPLVGLDPGPTASVAARLWPRFSPLAATPARVAALDLALVLLAEHELATSTLAVRVAASTGAGPAEVLLAGLGTVSGPLHGRAAVRVHQRLTRGDTDERDRRLHADGFGHLVHQGGDPRFAPLSLAVRELASRGRWAVVEADLARHAEAGAPPPNVDAALGALAFVGRSEPGTTEAVFAIARTAGWLAHAFEEADELPLRYRGRTLYRGPR
ncbi:citrate synthase [soil metagenome]